LFIAIAHLLFFHFLDGKREDIRSSSTPSQTYTTATSTILAKLFGLCIHAVLGAVFTQYLWRLLRLSPMNIMTIESMFTLRSDPISLLSTDVLRNGWMLVIITLLVWVESIAVSFPPSAMTVTTASYQNIVLRDKIPGLNMSPVCFSK
jgi:hypothetical protein